MVDDDAFLGALFASLTFLHASGDEISALETLSVNNRRFFMTRKAPSNETSKAIKEEEDKEEDKRQQPKPFDKVSDAAIRMFYALKEMQEDEDEEKKSCLVKLTSNMGTERTFATPSCFAQCLLEFMNNETQKGLYVHAKVN